VQSHESRIRKALRTATSRSRRSGRIIQKLFASATVRSESAPDRAVVVTFNLSYIDGASDQELARVLAWSLRRSAGEKLKCNGGA
jgi:hypothetical protein